MQANLNREALGLPHVSSGWRSLSGAPTALTCTPACSGSDVCFQGLCVSRCVTTSDFACLAGQQPTNTTQGCLCLPPGSDGGASVPPISGNACTWTPAGPTNFPGRVNSIAIDLQQPKNMYAATVGGIWRSQDGGRVWQRVSDDFLSQVTGTVAVNPLSPSEILVGLGDPQNGTAASALTGLVVSDSSADPGTFATVSGITSTAVASKIIYDPAPGNAVYVATDKGVFVGTRTASGLSFTALGGMSDPATDMAVDFTGSVPIVYAGVVGGSSFSNGVWKFDGTRWLSRSAGMNPAATGAIAVGLSKSAPGIIYARVDGDGLYRTDSAAEVPVGGAIAWRQNGTRFCRQRNEWRTDLRKGAICELLAPARALASLIPLRTLEVLRIDGPTYRVVGTWRDDAVVRAEPFDAIALDIASLWAT